MTFQAEIDRGETSLPVTVTATIQPYAQAVDMPQEYRDRFKDRLWIELVSVVDASGVEADIEDHERDWLRELVRDQAGMFS